MKDLKDRLKPCAGRCCVAACPMTLVYPVGAGRVLCWLHWLALGLPFEVIG